MTDYCKLYTLSNERLSKSLNNLLTQDEETALLLNLTPENREKLIINTMPLIVSISNKFYPPQYRQDLISVGVKAMLEIIDRWKPEYNVKLTSYAFKTLRWSMLRELKRILNPVYVAEGKYAYRCERISIDNDYDMSAYVDHTEPREIYDAAARKNLEDVMEERREWIAKEINRLPKRLRDTASILFIEFKSYAEVAARKNISVKTAYNYRDEIMHILQARAKVFLENKRRK